MTTPKELQLADGNPPIGVALTGASGVIYGIRLLQELVSRECRVHWTVSRPALRVIQEETQCQVKGPGGAASWFDGLPGHLATYHPPEDIGAEPASGSYPLRGVVIVPCSGGTLGRLAAGTSDSLVGRMAEVCLKERRPLIVVPRDTPFSRIHLTNMLTLNDAGAIILPANPGFYHQPESVDDVVNFVVARILDHLGFDGRPLIKGGWGALCRPKQSAKPA